MSAEAKRLDSVHFWNRNKVFCRNCLGIKDQQLKGWWWDLSERRSGIYVTFLLCFHAKVYKDSIFTFRWTYIWAVVAIHLQLLGAEAWTTMAQKFTSRGIQIRVRKTDLVSLCSTIFLFDSSSVGDLRFAIETLCGSTHSSNIIAIKPAGAGCLHRRELCALYQIL